MAKSVGKVAVEVAMAADTSQLQSGAAEVVSSFGRMHDGADAMGSGIRAANEGMGEFGSSVQRVMSIIENTLAMQNQQSRSINALFASQKRLARGSRKMADDIVQSYHDINKAAAESASKFHGKVDVMTTPHPQRSVDAASGDARAAQALLDENLRKQQQINQILQKTVGPRQQSVKWVEELNRLVQYQGDLQEEVLRYNNELVAAEKRQAVASAEVTADKAKRLKAEQDLAALRVSEEHSYAASAIKDRESEFQAEMQRLKSHLQERLTEEVNAEAHRVSEMHRYDQQRRSDEERERAEDMARLTTHLQERMQAEANAEAHRVSEMHKYDQQRREAEERERREASDRLKADIIRRNEIRLSAERAATSGARLRAGVNESFAGAQAPRADATADQVRDRLRGEVEEANRLRLAYENAERVRVRAAENQEDITELVEREEQAARDVNAQYQRVGRTRRDLLAAQQRENNLIEQNNAGYHDAHVIMQQLGSRQSQNALITLRLEQNAQRFRAAMDRARLSTNYTNEELEVMEQQFARINTRANAAGQFAGGNRFGAIVQQGAYATEDFASQIERGLIPALGGAANNMNMIVGMMGGPYAIAISASIIAGFQFAKALGLIGQEAEDSSDKIENSARVTDDLTESMKGLREQTRLFAELKFDMDLDSVADRMQALLNASAETADKLREINRNQLIQQEQDRLDDLDGWWNYLKTRWEMAEEIKDKNGDPADLFFGDPEETAKKKKALEDQLGRLGVNTSEATLEQMRLTKALLEQEKERLAITQRRNALERKAIADMGNVAPEDSRDFQTARQDAVRHSRERQRIEAEIAKLTKEQVSLATKAGKDHAESVAISERRLQVEEEIEQKRVEAERHIKAFGEANSRVKEVVEDAKDAYDKITETTHELMVSSSGVVKEWHEAADELNEFNAELDKVRDGVNGARRASQLYRDRIDEMRKSEQMRIDEALEAGEREKDLSVKINEEMKKRTDSVDRANQLEADIRNGLRGELATRAEIVALSRQAATASEELADLRNQARSGLESETSALESRLGAIDKEYAKQKKIREEREKLNEAIKAGLATNLIDPQRAKEMMTAFDEVVKAEGQIADLEGELGRTSTMAGEVKAVTRDSTEAQSIILNAMREGQQRAEQEPIINQLIQVHKAIERQTQIMSKPQTEGSLRPAVLKK